MNFTVPIAHLYLTTFLLNFFLTLLSTTYSFTHPLLTLLRTFISTVPQAYHIWAVVEIVFWFLLKLKKRWLESFDPLQMSLGAAPMMSAPERDELFSRIRSSTPDMEGFIRGWFFDVPLDEISRYDVLDWTSWSLFEGRNQEHLTPPEILQLKSFVLSIESDISNSRGLEPGSFSFPSPKTSGNIFSRLWAEFARQVRSRSRLAGLTNVGAGHAVEVLQSVYSDSYAALVTRGGTVDKIVRSLKESTDRNVGNAMEVAEGFKRAVGSAVGRTGRTVFKGVEMLRNQDYRTRVFGVADRSRKLSRKLTAFKSLLQNMRAHEASISSRQMCHVMRQISSLHAQVGHLEAEAKSAFHGLSALGQKLSPIKALPPMRYAKYSADPLFDICDYPLFSHLLMLGLTEGVTRVLLRKRGFKRGRVGDVGYWVRIPSTLDASSVSSFSSTSASFSSTSVPLVFVHGIGIGLVAYISFIDKMVATGRTIFLPEVSCVNAFRFWQTPGAIKNGAMVASTLSAMLSSHGFIKADFMGHSYGTSWLSYMAKISPEFVGR